MSQIEVILKQKVENLGAEADVIKVKRGYALNFLIPNGKAYEAKTYQDHLKMKKMGYTFEKPA